MKKIFILIVIIVLYALSYLSFRNSHNIATESGMEPKIIFPADKIAYYFYRPLEYIDGLFSGARFHIGPEQ